MYEPKDDALPIFLSDESMRGQIYNAISGFVGFINSLTRAGYGLDTLPDAYRQLYHLDYYDAQVRNGGHAQFIGNSGTHALRNLEDAKAAAHRLGLRSIAERIAKVETWCKENPEEAARQDGFSNRPPFLDPLDSELYAEKFSDADLIAYLNTLPETVAEPLRAMLVLPDTARAEAEAFVNAVVADFPKFNPQASVAHHWEKIGAYVLQQKHGLVSSDPEDIEKMTRSDCEHFSHYLDKNMEGKTADALRADLEERIERDLFNGGLYNRSRYHIHAYAWLAAHPNLRLVPRDQWAEEVQKIIDNSPFCAGELERRKLEAAYEALPDGREAALALMLGRMSEESGIPPRLIQVRTKDSAKGLHMVQTGTGSFFLVETPAKLYLHAVRKSRRAALTKELLALGTHFGMLNPTRTHHARTKLEFEVIGRKLDQSPEVPTLAHEMADAYLPEALAIWAEDHVVFRRAQDGTVTRLGSDLEWTLWNGNTPIQVRASKTKVSVRSKDGQSDYPLTLLQDYRAKYAPVTRKTA